MAPTRIRGTLGALNQLCICLGILGALLVNVVVPAAAWRTMFQAAAAPAALLGLGEDWEEWEQGGGSRGGGRSGGGRRGGGRRGRCRYQPKRIRTRGRQ